MLDWKRSDEELPEILEDVLAYNADTYQLEFGFRSKVDNDPIHWADFSFPVTHWAYCNLPE